MVKRSPSPALVNARREAAAEVSESVRALAANLLRIIRGAGRPDDLQAMLARAVAAGKRADELLLDPGRLAQLALVPIVPDDGTEGVTDPTERQIVDAALQLVAAELLDQELHRRKAANLFDQALQDRVEQLRPTRSKGRRKPFDATGLL